MSGLRKEFLLLRTLKGAPMSILFAFQSIAEAMHPHILAIATGYPKEEILDGLEVLKEMGLAVELPNGKWADAVPLLPYQSALDPDLINPN